MKKIIFCFGILTTIYGAPALAKVWDLNRVIKTADAAEKSDLAKLLSEISLKPENTSTASDLMRVTSIQAGSIFERAGIKVGDLVRTSSSTISKNMETSSRLSARKGLSTTTKNGSTSAVSSEGPCGTVVNSVPVYNQMSKVLEGCRLEVVERDSIYAGLGLKEGDVIQPNSGQMKMEVFQDAGDSEPSDRQ